MELTSFLQAQFGFQAFRPGQLPVINAIMKGASAIAIFPTGSGKSLCYQLPALLLPNVTLVVSPLLALIQDQIAFLRTKGIAAGSIDSTQTHTESQAVMQAIRTGETKILFVSVERFKNERFRRFLTTVSISLMVIDEAHCISEWGHNFRPNYLKLPTYRKQFQISQVLLLTATATSKVILDMSKHFHVAKENVTITGFYRPNLYLQILPCPEQSKLSTLVNWLQNKQDQTTIVYVTLQKTAESVASYINKHLLHAEPYHAGMPNSLRKDIQERFMEGKTRCIVATIAFGMGIDKCDIRNVIHFDLPKSIENYSQEIGRAGRDDNPANCCVLANTSSLRVLENFVYGDTPERTGIAYVLKEIKQASKDWEVLLNPLSMVSNIRQLPLKTLLVRLEILGLIKPLYSYFAEYKFQLLIEEHQLIQRFQGERRAFVEALCESSHKGRTWFTVNFDYLQQIYPSERSRALIALEYFQEQGWILLESKQMTEVYQVLDRHFDDRHLTDVLYQYFIQKERSEIKRMQTMLSLFQSEKCLSKALAEYFGDPQVTDRCGHCSFCDDCLKQWPQPAPLPPFHHYDMHTLCKAAREMIQEYFDVPPSLDLLCRYLCGITSPWLTKIKAKTLSGFGQLEQYRYHDVKSWLAKQNL